MIANATQGAGRRLTISMAIALVAALPSIAATVPPSTAPSLVTGKLTVKTAGSGSGRVEAASVKLVVPPAKTIDVRKGVSFTLNAQPSVGSIFAGWSGGACPGTALACTFTFSGDMTVTATFEPAVICGVDHDGDKHRPPGTATVYSADQDCLDPGEALLTAPADDCNDNNGHIYPGAVEVVGDEIDSDCDGAELCYVDADHDGYRARTGTVRSADFDCRDAGEALSSAPIDCDDTNPNITVQTTGVQCR